MTDTPTDRLAGPSGGDLPIDDPIPEEPVIDEPGRVIPVADPRPSGAGRPVREPDPPREPGTG